MKSPRNHGVAAAVSRLCRAWPAAIAAAATVGVAPAAAAPVNPCAPATLLSTLAPSRPNDWAENTAFGPRGDLWVSRILSNQVQHYDPAGKPIGSVPVESPGAVRIGPDGLVYVNQGDFPPTRVLPGQPRTATVVRFDPRAAAPKPQVFATGLGMANGGAFDRAGNYYVGDAAVGLVRFNRAGVADRQWNDRALLPNVNAVTIDGDSAIVTVDPGAVYRIALADPAQRTLISDLTRPQFPFWPDDFAKRRDGSIYVTSASGQVARIDQRSHVACTVFTTEPLSSAEFVPGSDAELLLGAVSGNLLRIRLNG